MATNSKAAIIGSAAAAAVDAKISSAATAHAKSLEPESRDHQVRPSFTERLRLRGVFGYFLRVVAAVLVGYSFAVTAWRTRHEPQDLAFVTTAAALLAALLACLRRAERLSPDSPAQERRRVQASVWALSTALSCAFAYRVAEVMPLPLAVLLWCTTAFDALASLYVVVLTRDQPYQALPTMQPAAERPLPPARMNPTDLV